MSTAVARLSAPVIAYNFPRTPDSYELIGNKMVCRFHAFSPVLVDVESNEVVTTKQLSKILDYLKFNKKSRTQVMQQLDKNGKVRKKFSITEISILLCTTPFLGATPIFAADFSVDKAFDPLIEIAKDLANPICYIMFIIGFIYVMIGRASEGFKRMQYAAFGYIGLQFAPGLMSIIKEIGTQIATKT